VRRRDIDKNTGVTTCLGP